MFTIDTSRIRSRTERFSGSVLDAYWALERAYPRKFLYLGRNGGEKVVGFGTVGAASAIDSISFETEGPIAKAPVLFSAGRFDPEDDKREHNLFAVLPQDAFVLPQVVLIEHGENTYLQVNALANGPVTGLDALLASTRAAIAAGGTRGSAGAAHSSEISPQEGAPRIDPADFSRDLPFALVPDSHTAWITLVRGALARIARGDFEKIVLARELRVESRSQSGFDSRTMLANLIAGRAGGTVFLCEFDGAFFIGATPELLVRKEGATVSTMCLAGTAAAGSGEAARAASAHALLHDEKNLREHAHVAAHLREAFAAECAEIDMPSSPGILSLMHVHHLYTPVTGKVCSETSLLDLRDRLHPTPALAGNPVNASRVAIREMEGFNRGLYGGPFGYLDLDGDGEFSVAIRSGVFSADYGYVYAGCGIVMGSDPDAEYEEIDIKLKTIFTAFQGTENE